MSLDDIEVKRYESAAALSTDGRYRYWLTRRWDAPGFLTHVPAVTFCMLNPSTADHQLDDPTIRRCIGFAERLRYEALRVVNVFAWRATNPRQLPDDPDLAVGDENALMLESAASERAHVFLAFGVPIRPATHLAAYKRAVEILSIGGQKPVYCFGRTKDGWPRHPLYLPKDAPMHQWWWPKHAN